MTLEDDCRHSKMTIMTLEDDCRHSKMTIMTLEDDSLLRCVNDTRRRHLSITQFRDNDTR